MHIYLFYLRTFNNELFLNFVFLFIYLYLFSTLFVNAGDSKNLSKRSCSILKCADIIMSKVCLVSDSSSTIESKLTSIPVEESVRVCFWQGEAVSVDTNDELTFSFFSLSWSAIITYSIPQMLIVMVVVKVFTYYEVYYRFGRSILTFTQFFFNNAIKSIIKYFFKNLRKLL